MRENIKSVLKKLGKQSELEKSEKIQVNHDERMLTISNETGEFFNILLKAMKAKKILEVGMSVGFSTLWFVDAILANNGKIVTIEENQDKITRAKKNFEEAGVSAQIEIQEGKALQILQKLATSESEQQQFDFVFLDADKENNIEYFDLVLPLVRVGGIIATDNILYPEEFRPEMKKFTEYIKSKPNVQTMTLDLGNGEEISIKTK
ncbi:MAG: O-methyltransferase family 3 [Nitrosopumilales archaeon]|nr:MAG: O-methyltransferase family 3 [Nitrosopumilales archaeon]